MTSKSATAQATPPDLLTLQTNITKAIWLWHSFGNKWVAQTIDKQPPMLKDDMGFAQAMTAWSQALAYNPHKLMQSSWTLWQDQWRIWLGGGDDNPAATDKRFRDPAWSEYPAVKMLLQSYLGYAKWWHSLLDINDGMSKQQIRKVDFFVRQMVDAMAPNNFALTNPQVWQEIEATNGENLVKGMENLIADLHDGQLHIRMTDTQAFKLGQDIANTPGKVIYRNDLIELIQYNPRSEKVRQSPLLIVPPWINKYYILDLQEKNSLVRWAVEQGHTVFMISWINPGESLRDKGFEDYMLEGVLAALDAVEQATGESEINTASYCIGGTLMAATLAYMAEKQDQRVKSATFFTTLLDFEHPGEIEVFLDDMQVSALEKRMDERGYLEGREMGGAFNLLRSNDLIWSFFVGLYLLGKDPMPFDLLYWNADSTRMPAKMHSYYLRNMYLENRLREPGGITLGGVPIDLRKITVPAYFVSAHDDHIAPWRSTYAGAKLFSGPVRFVLGASGHIAGIINPPSRDKYGHWTNPTLSQSADTWLKNAQSQDGSWWRDWDKWISQYQGQSINARQPGDGKLKAITDAPGTYVLEKSSAKNRG